jgi:hypothetical protein
MEQFNDIFQKIETIPIETPYKRLPGVTEMWQKTGLDTYVCKLSGRVLNKVSFRTYMDRSRHARMEFIIKVF